jgi:hypothetical protein
VRRPNSSRIRSASWSSLVKMRVFGIRLAQSDA